MTVNSELQAKIAQLSRTENDMKALLNRIRIGALFLDQNRNIKRFTSEVVKFFNLIPTDVGRPISDIRFNLKYDNLVQDAERVLDTLQNRELEIESEDGKMVLDADHAYPFFRRCDRRPGHHLYRLSMVKKSQEEVSRFQMESAQLTEGMLNIMRRPLAVLDEKLRFFSTNQSFNRTFHLSEGEAKGRRLFDLTGGQWDIPALRDKLESLLCAGKKVEEYVMDHDFSGIGRKKIIINGHRLDQGGMDTQMILLALEDVAEEEGKIQSALKG